MTPPPGISRRRRAHAARQSMALAIDTTSPPSPFATCVPITRDGWTAGQASALFIAAGGSDFPDGRSAASSPILSGRRPVRSALPRRPHGPPAALLPRRLAGALARLRQRMVYLRGGKMTITRAWAAELFPTLKLPLAPPRDFGSRRRVALETHRRSGARRRARAPPRGASTPRTRRGVEARACSPGDRGRGVALQGRLGSSSGRAPRRRRREQVAEKGLSASLLPPSLVRRSSATPPRSVSRASHRTPHLSSLPGATTSCAWWGSGGRFAPPIDRIQRKSAESVSEIEGAERSGTTMRARGSPGVAQKGADARRD